MNPTLPGWLGGFKGFLYLLRKEVVNRPLEDVFKRIESSAKVRHKRGGGNRGRTCEPEDKH